MNDVTRAIQHAFAMWLAHYTAKELFYRAARGDDAEARADYALLIRECGGVQ